MSTIIMAAVWPLQGMTAAQKAVLVSLADQANDDGVCAPRVKVLAANCCLSIRTVREGLAGLEKAKLLRRDYRPNNSTVYTVTPHGSKGAV